MRYLNFLLIFAPIALLGDLLHWSSTLVFVASALAVVPMAGILGEATEELAVHTGPRLGGLLNATLGNAAELIITIFAIRAGLLDLVKASITGSILGNLLLVLGASLFAGGLRHGLQTFDRTQATVNATSLILAVVALAVPSLFNRTMAVSAPASVEYLSVSVAVLMILIYILGLVYSLRRSSAEPSLGTETPESKGWSLTKALVYLTITTVALAVMSEVLVGSVEAASRSLGLTEFFIGVIVVPIIGNVAEHVVGVQSALRNRMELSLSISIGSSLQIALFVAPILVFISLLLGNPLTLVFSVFEVAALSAAAMIAAFVAHDGESTWLEGAQLLVVYAILAFAFFFLPSA